MNCARDWGKMEAMILVAAIAAAVAALTHLSPFPGLLEVGYRKTSLWRADSGAPVVYLTFDDGPNPSATPALLDTLREKGVQATFFVIPEHVTAETAPLLMRMRDEGHAIAQHTGARWLFLLPPDELVRRLDRDADHIQAMTGHRPSRIFRPHAGWRSIPMLEGLKRHGYRLAGWTWMSWDWYWFKARTGERVARQIAGQASPGQIVVIHDGHHRNPNADRRYAVEAASLLIDALRAKGYRFAPLPDAP